MINDLNRIQLMGYVGADAVSPKSDNAPVTFSIATSDRWTVNETRQTRTDWHSIAVFGNLRKYAGRLKKGERVYIEGQLRSNSYDKTVGGETIKLSSFEVIANQIERLTITSDTEQ